MVPAQFDYYRATDVEDALDLLETHADRDPELLAGGHGLLPSMKAGEASPEVVVDVGGLDDLRSIEREDGAIDVGALVTHADLAANDECRSHAPVLAEAAENVGDVQIRNRGTIGGNLAEADPTADPPAAILAADATIRLRGREGDRTVPAAEFFRGSEETALRDDELVASVRVPRRGGEGAYVKKTHPATGYAMVGVAANVATDGGTVAESRVAANGVTNRPVRLASVENALAGAPLESEAIAAAAERATDDLDPQRTIGDDYASAEFRARLLVAYTERALEAALDRIDGNAVDGNAVEGSGGAGR